MAKNAVGVYISEKYIDIAELTGLAGSPTLANFIREEIPTMEPPQEGADGQSSAQGAISAALKQGLSKLSSKPDKVYTVLRSGDVMIRYFDMPILPKSEQPQAIRFESKKYIPFKIDDVVSDYKVLESSKEKQTMGVFFTAATKDTINNYVDMFKAAESEVFGIDIIPFALIRMLYLSKKLHKKENVAILHIDNDKKSASIHVVAKDLPFFSRDLKISADDKDSLFEKLASEVRVSLDYYRRHNQDAEVSKVLVCGEQIFPGLGEYIKEELKVESEALESIIGVKGADKVSLSAIIAIGTALGGIGKTAHSVNLSPIAAAMQKKKEANLLVVGSIAAAVLILATFLAGGLQVKRVSDVLKAVGSQHKMLPSKTDALSIDGLKKLKDKAIKSLKFSEVALNKRLSWTVKLSRLAENLPDGIWFEKFSAEEKFTKKGDTYLPQPDVSISIAGSAFLPDANNEPEYISKYFTALKEDEVLMEYFDSIELGNIEKKDAKGYVVASFTISISGGKAGSGKAKPKWQRR